VRQAVWWAEKYFAYPIDRCIVKIYTVYRVKKRGERTMYIPYKLYMRLTELAAEYYRTPTKENDKALVTFQDDIRWPYSASPEQIEDWNEWHERAIVTPGAV
jgi:hypothetical protein